MLEMLFAPIKRVGRGGGWGAKQVMTISTPQGMEQAMMEDLRF